MPRKRSIIFFYILVVYVFASFLWWSYLLLDKNKTAFVDEARLNRLTYNYENDLPKDAQNYFNTHEYANLKEEYNNQKWMILGEGAFFLLFLALGTYKLWQTLTRELSLARQQHNFLLSITHELKSPLASIKLSLQTLLKRGQLGEKYVHLVNNSLEDVDRLTDLVDNILIAVKMEGRSYAFHKKTENISEIIEHVVEMVRKYYRNEVEIKTELEEDIYLEADKTTFSSAIHNLMENAVKYSVNGAKVSVSLHKYDNEVIIEVKDEGVGIPEGEREKVFKKFYRIGNEETRSAKGTGLGLYIVKNVVENHGGKITVRDNVPKGTIMQLIFPANHHIRN